MAYTYESPEIEVGKISLVPADQARIPIDISKAKSGDPEAANRVLARFVGCVENKAPLDDRIVEFILESFKRALDGESLDQEFGLKRRRGAPKNPALWEKRRKVWAYVLSKTLAGSTIESALGDAADQFPEMKADNIERDYKTMKKLHREVIENSYPVTEEDWDALRRFAQSTQT